MARAMSMRSAFKAPDEQPPVRSAARKFTRFLERAMLKLFEKAWVIFCLNLFKLQWKQVRIKPEGRRKSKRAESLGHEDKTSGEVGEARDHGPAPPAYIRVPPLDLREDPVHGQCSDEIQVNPFAEISEVPDNLNKSVILNHGSDLDQDFVTLLKNRFCAAGFDSFMDVKSFLKRRHTFNFNDDLFKRVHVHVAILSKGFAKSKHCLNELCDMVRSKKPLIVVPYGVEPDQLHLSDGPWSEMFHEYLEKGWGDDVRRWKTAIEQAMAKGLLSTKVNNNLTKLVENIVASASNYVPLVPSVPDLVSTLHPPAYANDHFEGMMAENVGSIQPEQLNVIEKLVFSSMKALDIRQTPARVEHGVHQLVQSLQGNSKGVVVGRLDTSTMQIEIILLDFKTMVDITGVGLDLNANMTRVGLETDDVVMVTLEGNRTTTEAIMTKTKKDKLDLEGEAFYLLHCNGDNGDNCIHNSLPHEEGYATLSSVDSVDHEVYGAGDDHSALCREYRVHTMAKLLMLLRCKEAGNRSFWLKVKDFAKNWHWWEIFQIALVECGNIWEGIHNDHVKFIERSGHGGNGRRTRPHKNFPSGSTKGKEKIGDYQGALSSTNGGASSGANGGDGGEEEGDDDIKLEKNLFPSAKELKSYKIEVHPGYDTFRVEKEDKVFPYKKVYVYATPYIIVSFRMPSAEHVISEREIHVEVKVNFDLAHSSEPSAEEVHQFAWYHDFFKFSFESTEEDVVRLVPDSGKVGKVKDFTSTTSRSVTSIPAQRTTVVAGEVKLLGPIGQVTTSVATSTAEENHSTSWGNTSEWSRKQTESGFEYAQAFSTGSQPSIGCKFMYKDIAPHVFSDDGTIDEGLYTIPVCNSTTEAIEGTFKPLLEKKNFYPYKFKCRRNLKGVFWRKPQATSSSRSSHWYMKKLNLGCMPLGKETRHKTPPWIKQTCYQVFSVRISINHGVKHIVCLAEKHHGSIPPVVQAPDGAPNGARGGYAKVIGVEKIISNKTHPYDGYVRRPQEDSSD